MTLATPITRSVRDAALDLINAAETLRETRLTSLVERDTFNSQREARSRAYFIEKDRANG